MSNLKCNTVSENGIVPFSVFLQQVGKSANCGWRWRRKNWVNTMNVAGRLYIAKSEIERFQKRAAAGEFAK
jgi:hypothetical protein